MSIPGQKLSTGQILRARFFLLSGTQVDLQVSLIMSESLTHFGTISLLVFL